MTTFVVNALRGAQAECPCCGVRNQCHGRSMSDWDHFIMECDACGGTWKLYRDGTVKSFDGRPLRLSEDRRKEAGEYAETQLEGGPIGPTGPQ